MTVGGTFNAKLLLCGTALKSVIQRVRRTP